MMQSHRMCFWKKHFLNWDLEHGWASASFGKKGTNITEKVCSCVYRHRVGTKSHRLCTFHWFWLYCALMCHPWQTVNSKVS
jgi:hypothetical protein